MKKFLASLGIVVFLSGCAYGSGGSAEADLAVACSGYAGTVSALSAVKPNLTEDQRVIVDNAIVVAGPICRDAANGLISDYDSAVFIVRDSLRALLVIQQGEQS